MNANSAFQANTQEDYGYSPFIVMEALNLFHRLVPGRQRRYRLQRCKENVNRSMDSILDRLDGSKRPATYPNSEVNTSLLPFFISKNRIIVRAWWKSWRTKGHACHLLLG